MLDRIREPFRARKLGLIGETRIVYCKDTNPTAITPISSSRFSAIVRPRKALDKSGRVYVKLSPAVALKAIGRPSGMAPATEERQEPGRSIGHVSPILKGWQQYYGRFRGSALKPVWRSMHLFLIRWLMRKHKRLARFAIPRERPSPACSPTTPSRSAWTARARGGTTSSSSGYGARSNTRRSISGPMTASPRRARRSAGIWTSTIASVRIRALTADARSRLLHPAANPHGSLTPADAPLIDAENLFRQPGPPQRTS